MATNKDAVKAFVEGCPLIRTISGQYQFGEVIYLLEGLKHLNQMSLTVGDNAAITLKPFAQFPSIRKLQFKKRFTLGKHLVEVVKVQVCNFMYPRNTLD